MNFAASTPLLASVAFVACTSRSSGASGPSNGLQPPIAEKRPHVTTVHGDTLTDDYFWLRERTNPKVMEYLKEEDGYADAMMKPTAALQDALYHEILSHIKQTDDTVPYRENGDFYYSRTREGLQYPIYLRKRNSLAAPEEVILDQNELARDRNYLAIGARAVSDDGNLLVYTVDTTGYRQYTLQVKDLRTGQLLPDKIERVDSVAWATDNQTVFYVTEDPVTKRHDRFWRHIVGTDRSDLVHEEKDELFDLDCQRSRDKAVILLQAAAKTSTEVSYLPADRPTAALRVVVPRQPDHEYDVSTAATSSTSAPTKARRTFASSRRRSPSRRSRTGRRSSRTNRQSRSRASTCFRATPCFRNGRTACSRSRSSISPPARAGASGIQSRSTRRVSAPTWSSGRRYSATNTSRWSRRARSSTTT